MEVQDIVMDTEYQEEPPDVGSPYVPGPNLPVAVGAESDVPNIIVYISDGTSLQKIKVKESECTDIIVRHSSTSVIKYINREIVIDKRPQEYNIFGERLPKVSHSSPVPRQGRNIVLSKIITPARRFARYIPDLEGNFHKQIYDPNLVELSTEYEPATDEEVLEDPDDIPEDYDQSGLSFSSNFTWLLIWWQDIFEFYRDIYQWLYSKGLWLYRYYKNIEPEQVDDGTRASRIIWT